MKDKLCIIDCIEGARGIVTTFPYLVGGSASAKLRLNGAVAQSGRDLFEVHGVEGGYQVQPVHGFDHFVFDGQDVEFIVVQDLEDHTLVIGGHPFLLRCDGGHPFLLRCDGQLGSELFPAIDHSKWFVYKKGSKEWLGPVPPQEVPIMTTIEPGEFIVMCKGMQSIGFYAHHVVDALAGVKALEESSSLSDDEDWLEADPELEESEIDTEYGEFTCPVCWFKFDRGDVMNIAVHADLRGDPVLGEEEMIRYYATRFNDRHQALDAMGLAAPDCACPHCRRRLPPGFLDQPHHIFSIIGAPSSGKSYYLSVLVKLLQAILFKKFSASFRDAAPEDNAVLNDMRNHLFSASKPEDAYLAKTELEGALYETLPRQGRLVKLPKPFIYLVSSRKVPDDGFSIVFYDNAGEHFEPGSNTADSPGAQHISVASGIFFLFDPLYNPDFKARIKSKNDPQLKQQRNDQQDVILSESEVRIKQILGLTTTERVTTPMAVIVGKSDAWIELLGPEPLLPLFGDEEGETLVLTSNIDKNSNRVRDLLLDLCPAIVANAEEISSNVRFFASSPLGHSPVEFIDSEGSTKIGPDPKMLDPQRVEDATIWVLTQISPSIFPCDQPI
jgi:hypothetical protein